MCGIAGILTARPANALDLEALKKMTRAVQHRGPDGEAYWQDPADGVAFGHQRLSIVDLSAHGAQPMHSADRRFVITFNGEIYNHRSIRQQLDRELDIDWRGNSDTEVLIEAISAWGLTQTLESVVGMFAFCVYDRQRKLASLVRDRFGEKPCYFSRIDTETFIFASELRSFENYPGFKADLDRSAVATFMRLGHVPASQCIYQNVAKLPAASVLSFNPERLSRLPDTRDMLRTASVYWSASAEFDQALTRRHQEQHRPDCAATAHEVERVLRDSIGLRLQADVPVGIFLSGGIDSPTIAALARQVSKAPLKSFSIGVKDDSINSFADSSSEADRAAAIATALGTDHHELNASSADAAAVAMAVPAVYDEPFADPSQIPTILVSKLASQSVKVCLTGDGGDELFAGYNRHLWSHGNWPRLNRLPRAVRHALGDGITRLSGYQWDRVYASIERILPATRRTTDPGTKLHKLAQTLRCDTARQMYDSLIIRNNDAEIWRRDFELNTGDDPGDAVLENATPMDQFQLWDMQGYLQDAILTKVDRASMHHGLETRLPFLDPSLTRLAMQIPPACKIHNQRGKYVLRQILSRHLPSIDFTQPKSGFILPLDAWLRTDAALKDWANELLSRQSLAQERWLNADHVAKLWRQHQHGSHNHVSVLWNVLMFMAWRAACRDRGVV